MHIYDGTILYNTGSFCELIFLSKTSFDYSVTNREGSQLILNPVIPMFA